MLTEQHRKESLSRAYVRAIAAKCGMSSSVADLDYGIDVRLNVIQRLDGKYFESGPHVNIQIKSTAVAEVTDSSIIYDLEASTYNYLRESPKYYPRILVLVVLPEEECDWLAQTEDGLAVRRCAYWYSLKGKPATTNSGTKRIKIPRTNVFSPQALVSMMARIKKGRQP